MESESKLIIPWFSVTVNLQKMMLKVVEMTAKRNFLFLRSNLLLQTPLEEQEAKKMRTKMRWRRCSFWFLCPIFSFFLLLLHLSWVHTYSSLPPDKNESKEFSDKYFANKREWLNRWWWSTVHSWPSHSHSIITSKFLTGLFSDTDCYSLFYSREGVASAVTSQNQFISVPSSTFLE